MIVSEREFYIWRLEKWWVAFDNIDFRPENRKHLFGNWYWRT
jgi:hypothetical protein